MEATLEGSSSQRELSSVGALPMGAVLRGHCLGGWGSLQGEQSSGDTTLTWCGGRLVPRGSGPRGEVSFSSSLPPQCGPWQSLRARLSLLPTSSGSDNTVLTLSKDAVTHSNASPHQPVCDLWRDPVSSKNFSKCIRSMTRPPERPSPCSSNHTMLAAGPGE